MTAEVLSLFDHESDPERERLEVLEAVVERGRRAFVEVGQALAEIRRRKLYRRDYATFEAYLEGRWEMKRAHAYRAIAAAEVVENVSNWRHELPLPANESQARPLTRLPADEQPEVWERVVDTAPGGKVTAAHVEEVVAELLVSNSETSRQKESPPKPVPAVGDRVVLRLQNRHDPDLNRWDGELAVVTDILDHNAPELPVLVELKTWGGRKLPPVGLDEVEPAPGCVAVELPCELVAKFVETGYDSMTEALTYLLGASQTHTVAQPSQAYRSPGIRVKVCAPHHLAGARGTVDYSAGTSAFVNLERGGRECIPWTNLAELPR